MSKNIITKLRHFDKVLAATLAELREVKDKLDKLQTKYDKLKAQKKEK